MKQYFSKQNLTLFLATGVGFGYLKPAPGTWGTLPGVALAALLMPFPWLLMLMTIMLFVLGVYVSEKASHSFGKHDDGRIVIDEIVGVMLTFWWFEPTWLTLLLGFLWFRLFDIVKPPPIKQIDQRVSGGLGVMIDDVVAGVFAWIALYASLSWLF